MVTSISPWEHVWWQINSVLLSPSWKVGSTVNTVAVWLWLMLEHDIFALNQTHFKRFHSLGLRIWLQNYRKLFTLCRRSHSFQCCTPLIHKIRACFTSSISVSLRQWLIFFSPLQAISFKFFNKFFIQCWPCPLSLFCSAPFGSVCSSFCGLSQSTAVVCCSLVWYPPHPRPYFCSSLLF